MGTLLGVQAARRVLPDPGAGPPIAVLGPPAPALAAVPAVTATPSLKPVLFVIGLLLTAALGAAVTTSQQPHSQIPRPGESVATKGTLVSLIQFAPPAVGLVASPSKPSARLQPQRHESDAAAGQPPRVSRLCRAGATAGEHNFYQTDTLTNVTNLVASSGKSSTGPDAA